MNFLDKKKILLIVTGGIASYKSLDLIRRLQERNVNIECIITKNAEKFVNILSFESLLGKKTHSNLFSLDEENNMKEPQQVERRFDFWGVALDFGTAGKQAA